MARVYISLLEVGIMEIQVEKITFPVPIQLTTSQTNFKE